MDDFLDKIPSPVRYIFAIPVAAICVVALYYIFYFGNLWVASPDSLFIKIFNFCYINGLSVLFLILAVAYIVPNYQFEIALGLGVSIIIFAIFSFGYCLAFDVITVKLAIGYVLSILASIYSCYYTYSEFYKK